MPEKLIKLWVHETGEQIISQIEMFALICVRHRYAARLHDRVGISWIDNESAKYACIKGTSLSHSMLVMCRVLQQIEAERPSSVWYERVSSHSNPGDLPSRNQVKRASQLFSANAENKWVPPTNLVEAIIMLHEKPYSFVHTLFKGGANQCDKHQTRMKAPDVKKGRRDCFLDAVSIFQMFRLYFIVYIRPV